MSIMIPENFLKSREAGCHGYVSLPSSLSLSLLLSTVHKHLLSTYHEPRPKLDSGETSLSKTEMVPVRLLATYLGRACFLISNIHYNLL